MSKKNPDNGWIGTSIAEAATNRQSMYLFVLSIGVAVVSYFVSKESTAPLWLLWIVIIGFLVVIGILLGAIRVALDKDKLALPQVLKCVLDVTDSEHPVLLLSPSPLFGTSNTVSIYHRDPTSDFEILVAHGFVRTVQSDSKIQVKIEHWERGNSEIEDGLKNNNADIIEGMIVRASVARERTVTDDMQNLYKAIMMNMQPPVFEDENAVVSDEVEVEETTDDE